MLGHQLLGGKSRLHQGGAQTSLFQTHGWGFAGFVVVCQCYLVVRVFGVLQTSVAEKPPSSSATSSSTTGFPEVTSLEIAGRLLHGHRRWTFGYEVARISVSSLFTPDGVGVGLA